MTKVRGSYNVHQVVAATVCLLLYSSFAISQDKIEPAEARAIAKEAYTFNYSGFSASIHPRIGIR